MILVFAMSSGVAAERLSDQAISDAVEDELTYDPAIWQERIYIATRNGVVVLNGVTDNVLEKDRATRIARTVKGVRSVVNNIAVVPAILKTAEGLQNDVIENLASDPATDAYEISVKANTNGRITLTGTVDSWQEKELAEIVAKGTIGVTAVNNEITVKFADGRKRATNEIRAEVRQRLFWDVLVNDGLIEVAVEGDTVKLSGTVGSAAERYRARWLSRVTGALKVDANALEVQDWAKDPNRRNPDYVVKSDDDVVRAIRDAMRYDPRIDRFKIDVTVEDGRATLRGQVNNLAAKLSAEQVARNTVGVFKVVNRIRVKPSLAVSDMDLAKRINVAFLRDPYVEDYEISVVVQRGVAKLYGAVDSAFEKSQAQRVAERVDGIIGVVNHLDVQNDRLALGYDPYLPHHSPYPPYEYRWYNHSPAPSFRADQEIRRDIRRELWWSPLVDAEDIKVSVAGGQATLSGKVGNWAEWNAANENAWEGGASWVINKLKVDPGSSS